MIFKDNKYTKLYFKIIEYRKQNVLKVGENHHIIPKSLGGNDVIDNLVKVSCREHFILHRLLPKMVILPDHIMKMWCALHRMMHCGRYLYSSRLYEYFRNEWIQSLKGKNYISSDKRSLLAQKQWKDNIERKRKTSIKIKEYWRDNREKMIAIARENGKKADYRNNPITLKIEYKGKTYFGWRELKEETGVSKHLYRKYYVKGYDPEARIGKDGPIMSNYALQPLTTEVSL